MYDFLRYINTLTYSLTLTYTLKCVNILEMVQDGVIITIDH